jgi:radical SAM protein with 4Fe4S-binding SPASM domain
VVTGFPISVSLEPTTSCNLRCPECPSGLRSFTRPTGMMDAGLAFSLIDQLNKDILYLIFYFQGEPFLNPSLLKMIKYASKKKIYTAISTNAHYITEEVAEHIVRSGLDRLIVSLDGITQEVYEQYRVGGNINKVFEGVKNIQAAKEKLHSKTPYTVYQFLVTAQNEHQVVDAKAMAKRSGIPVAFKTAQIYNYEEGSPLIPKQSRYSRYRQNKDGRYRIKNKLENHCWRLWNSSVITWDGSIVPCCFDKDAHFKMGDARQMTFKNIWKSQAYQYFRGSVLKSRKEIDICKNCSEGTKVWN